MIKTTATGVKFDLKASNGHVIGTSEVYTTESACRNGIESVKKNAATDKIEDQTVSEVVKVTNPKYEVYTDKKGEFRFRLNAKNGENILASEGYKAKESCLKGIASVQTNAPTAEVVAE